MTKVGKVKYYPMIKLLYKQQGIFGLYRGFWGSALAATPGWAIYFSLYHKLKEIGKENEYWTKNKT